MSEPNFYDSKIRLDDDRKMYVHHIASTCYSRIGDVVNLEFKEMIRDNITTNFIGHILLRGSRRVELDG